MRILVTGSRDWGDHRAVIVALEEIAREHNLCYEPDEYGNTLPDPSKMTVVHGACPTGADMWADEWAITNCDMRLVERHPADWDKHGRAAGPIRNKEMVDAGADLCLAFISSCTSPRCNIEGTHPSHGASGCADLAEKAGIPTKRFTA